MTFSKYKRISALVLGVVSIVPLLTYADSQEIIKEDKLISPLIKLDKVDNNKNDEDIINLLSSDLKVLSKKLVTPTFDNDKDFLYIREKSTDKIDYIAKLFKDQVAEVLEEENDKFKVKSGDIIGYITKENLTEKINSNSIKKIAICLLDTKLYENTSADAKPIQDIKENTSINVTSSKDGWLSTKITKKTNDSDEPVKHIKGYVKEGFFLVKETFTPALTKKQAEIKEKEQKEKEKKEKEQKEKEQKEKEKKEKEQKQKEQKQKEQKKKKQTPNVSKPKPVNKPAPAKPNKPANKPAPAKPNKPANKPAPAKPNKPAPALAYNGNKGQAIANAALAQLGANQDCTMLVTNALRSVGINFHSAPIGYSSLGQFVPSNQARLGDLIYYDNGGAGLPHIAVYLGNGKAVHGGFNGYSTVVQSSFPNYNPKFIRVR